MAELETRCQACLSGVRIFGFRWFGRSGRAVLPPDERRLNTQIEHDQLINTGLKLRNQAIERVVNEADNPIEALEVVAVATHSGRGSPVPIPRRTRDDPLSQLALKMIDRQFEKDPMDELDRVLDRRERLEEVADQVTGRRRRRAGQAGDGIGETIAAIADTELGRALGAAFGMAISAGHVGPPLPSPQPSAALTPPPGAEAGGQDPTPAGAPAATPAPQMEQPMNIRVGIALRMLRAMKPEQAARWLWDNAEDDEMLSQLLDTAIATEPEVLPAFLEAICGEAAAHPDQAQWLPLLQELRDNRVFALAMHTELRAIAAAEPASLEAEAQ